MTERELFKAAAETAMPNFDAVRENCINAEVKRSSGMKRYRGQIAAAACLAVILIAAPTIKGGIMGGDSSTDGTATAAYSRDTDTAADGDAALEENGDAAVTEDQIGQFSVMPENTDATAYKDEYTFNYINATSKAKSETELNPGDYKPMTAEEAEDYYGTDAAELALDGYTKSGSRVGAYLSGGSVYYDVSDASYTSDAGSITVKLSKVTALFDPPETYEENIINGTSVALFATDSGYEAYWSQNGTNFAAAADNLTQETFVAAVLQILEG